MTKLLTSIDGFQLLHAVYIVERFLENLVKRHCQFHIAFFESRSFAIYCFSTMLIRFYRP